MFSDRYRWIKIGMALVIIIAAGAYYNLKRTASHSDMSPYQSRTEKNANRSICLQNVRIKRGEGQFFVVIRNRKIPLFNLPESVQRVFVGDFAILGKITNDNHFLVEKIHRKQSRLLKMVYSIMAAIAVCYLFLVFFRLNREGFCPKETE